MGKFLAMGSKQRTPANPLSPYQLHGKKDHCGLLHDVCLNRTSVFKKEASSKTEAAEVICTPKDSEKWKWTKPIIQSSFMFNGLKKNCKVCLGIESRGRQEGLGKKVQEGLPG